MLVGDSRGEAVFYAKDKFKTTNQQDNRTTPKWSSSMAP